MFVMDGLSGKYLYSVYVHSKRAKEGHVEGGGHGKDEGTEDASGSEGGESKQLHTKEE